jgi:hypothetical protein
MSDEWIVGLYQLVRASYIYWPKPTHPHKDLRMEVSGGRANPQCSRPRMIMTRLAEVNIAYQLALIHIGSGHHENIR